MSETSMVSGGRSEKSFWLIGLGAIDGLGLIGLTLPNSTPEKRTGTSCVYRTWSLVKHNDVA